MYLLYLIIALISTILAAMVGVGGGLIMVPVLTCFNNFSVASINVLASATGLVMAIVATTKQFLNKQKINVKITIFLVIGSILGSLIGTKVFKGGIKSLGGSDIVIIEAILLIGVLSFILYYVSNKSKYKSKNVKNLGVTIGIGLFTGIICAFLGIGGGVLNVPLLQYFFSMDIKEATRNSIFMIVFLQASKMVEIALTGGFASYNLEVLPVMIIGAVVGGLVGTSISRKNSAKTMNNIFKIVVIGIIIVNIINIAKVFI